MMYSVEGHSVNLESVTAVTKVVSEENSFRLRAGFTVYLVGQTLEVFRSRKCRDAVERDADQDEATDATLQELSAEISSVRELLLRKLDQYHSFFKLSTEHAAVGRGTPAG